MNYTLESLTQEALAFEPTPDQPHLTLAVTGGSATGKSTIVHHLQEVLGPKATTFSLDRYQLGGNYPGFSYSAYRYDDPRNFRLAQAAQDIRSLLAGNVVQPPSFTVGNASSEAAEILESRPVLLIDGIYAAHEELATLADRKVYVEAPLYARFLRRLFRLEHEHRKNNPEAALRHSLGPTLQAHRDFITPQKNTANVVMATDYTFEETITNYALQPILNRGLPTNRLWKKHELAFRLGEYSVGALFQIRYRGKIYSQFHVDNRHIELLPPPDSTVFEEL